ncbi:MAG: FtsX-like permease family protein [Eubacteriales bacterium]|nr:FtsX-like permease family protein [Eubacteriales bacterium]MDY3332637.1 FtsX-like permease family protein [Gallibacter sp.]
MLKRKMLRDIKKNISQFIAIFFMVMIGIMVYTGIEAYMTGMEKSADRFYEETNLFDLELYGNDFSKKDIEKLKDIKHVKDAERKLSIKAESGKEKTLLVNFIESNNICKLHVIEGEKFDVDKKGVYLDERYAKENNIKVGDYININYDSMKLSEKVLATINVADHLYDVKDDTEIFSSRKDLGFAYLSVNEIPEAFIKEKIMKKMNIPNENMFNAVVKDFDYKEYIPFNNIMIDVDSSENINYVKEESVSKLSNALVATKREENRSYSTYQGEINEGRAYVGIFSGLFLFIALLSVVTTMTRIIKKQRVQIGTLKAIGFKNSVIMKHYVGYAFWISLVAAIFGLLIGYYAIGGMFMHMQMSFFELPDASAIMHSSSYVVAVGVVIVTSAIAMFTGRSILMEKPAETLKVGILTSKKTNKNFTKGGIFKKMSFSTIWNIRDIFRNKIRVSMGVVGLMACSILIICAMGMANTMDHFIKVQFEDICNFEYKTTLKKDITKEELKSLENKYGDSSSQTLLIEIKYKDGEKSSNNAFVSNTGDMLRPINNDYKPIKFDDDSGVYMTYKLAANKGYKLGDEVEWRIYGSDKYYKSKIVGFNKDPQNQNISMTKTHLEAFHDIEYKADSLYSIKKVDRNLPGVELVQSRNKLKDSMNHMVSVMRSMIYVIIIVAIMLGLVIIYSIGVLSYTEKQYQFATLKVLGFPDKKIKRIFIKQNNWIAIISIILGLPLGYQLTNYLFENAIEETYDFSAYIEPMTYIVAGVGSFLVTLIVSQFLARKIRKIDMVSSLKASD